MKLLLAILTVLSLNLGCWTAETRLLECPISLTNPDGQALDLERYELRAAVHGPLALVEMEMTFRNPQPRQMEGRFLYLLPPGATVSRFAKEVDGKLMEGEVVERMRAQRIFTEILHTMRDPALLEQDQGNRFSARVFPIPANGTTRLLLSYSQILTPKNDMRRLTVPLAGMPQMKSFTATLVFQDLPESAYHSATFFGKIEKTDAQPQVVSRTVADFKPEEDWVVNFAGLKDPHHATVIRAGNYQMTAYRPEGGTSKDALEPLKESVRFKAWEFHVDTSASGADSEPRRLAAIEKLVDGIETAQLGQRIFAATFDIEIAPLVSIDLGKSDEKLPPAGRRVTDLLRKRHALGATNLEAALKHIGEQARATKESTRFVLVSDGIATFGAREPRELLAALGEWPEEHVLHALVLGPKQDAKTLAAIVEKTHGRVVTVSLGSDMEKSVEQAVAELQRPVGASFEFYDEGAEWIHPKSFRDVRPGDEVVVFSRVKDGATAKPGVIQRNASGKVVKDQPLAAPPREAPAFAPLFEREACAAYLNHLEKLEQETTDAAKIAELRKQRVETSVKHRVLCPLTSLLVLETEHDYARFGIDRKALADVMVVGNKGIELRHRTAEDQPVTQVAQFRERLRHSQRKLVDVSKSEADAKPAEAGEEAGKDRLMLYKATDGLEDARVANRAVDSSLAPASDAIGGGGARRRELRDEILVERADAPATPRPSEPAPAATSAPAATTPAVPPPARQPEQQRAQQPGQGQAQVQQGPQQPGWTAQHQALPKDDELNALRAQVAAAPRERRLRNTYADALLKKQDWDGLQALAFEWLPFDPENPQIFEFLGKSATGLKDVKTALRAFTSIAEIAPNRAALLARAGWLLLIADQHEMAVQMFREALKNRDDDPNIYRGLALAFWLKGNFAAAADTLEGALKKDFNNRYGDARRVLNEELGYVYRAWLKAVQTHADDTHARASGRAAAAGVDLKRVDAIRVTLGWETDANDVDLHVVDPAGEECFYSHKNNASGLELYSDQTQGLGPEVIRCSKAQKGVYHVGVNYFAAGPMGVSRGVVVILQPNAEGLVERPQIVPFCLVEGGADMRHLATVVVP